MPEKKEYIRKSDGYRVALTEEELDGIHGKSDFQLYDRYVDDQLADAKRTNAEADQVESDKVERAAKRASDAAKPEEPKAPPATKGK